MFQSGNIHGVGKKKKNKKKSELSYSLKRIKKKSIQGYCGTKMKIFFFIKVL